MKFKYIIFDYQELVTPVIFPVFIKHDAVASKFPHWKVVSAGFVTFDGATANTFGDSVSLDVKAGKEDSEILNRYMRA